LLEVERRLSQDLAVEIEANRAYYAYRAGGRMRDGRRFGKPPAVWVAPEEPTGEINLTDPDSRTMLLTRGFVQGYNAQAAVNEQHVVLAAEICVVNPDFGNLEPVVLAAETELASAGVTDTPTVVLADAGYCIPNRCKGSRRVASRCWSRPTHTNAMGSDLGGPAVCMSSCAACLAMNTARISTVAGRE
jgi:hypothetical protein